MVQTLVSDVEEIILKYIKTNVNPKVKTENPAMAVKKPAKLAATGVSATPTKNPATATSKKPGKPAKQIGEKTPSGKFEKVRTEKGEEKWVPVGQEKRKPAKVQVGVGKPVPERSIRQVLEDKLKSYNFLKDLLEGQMEKDPSGRFVDERLLNSFRTLEQQILEMSAGALKKHEITAKKLADADLEDASRLYEKAQAMRKATEESQKRKATIRETIKKVPKEQLTAIEGREVGLERVERTVAGAEEIAEGIPEERAKKEARRISEIKHRQKIYEERQRQIEEEKRREMISRAEGVEEEKPGVTEEEANFYDKVSPFKKATDNISSSDMQNFKDAFEDLIGTTFPKRRKNMIDIMRDATYHEKSNEEIKKQKLREVPGTGLSRSGRMLNRQGYGRSATYWTDEGVQVKNPFISKNGRLFAVYKKGGGAVNEYILHFEDVDFDMTPDFSKEDPSLITSFSVGHATPEQLTAKQRAVLDFLNGEWQETIDNRMFSDLSLQDIKQDYASHHPEKMKEAELIYLRGEKSRLSERLEQSQRDLKSAEETRKTEREADKKRVEKFMTDVGTVYKSLSQTQRNLSEEAKKNTREMKDVLAVMKDMEDTISRMDEVVRVVGDILPREEAKRIEQLLTRDLREPFQDLRLKFQNVEKRVTKMGRNVDVAQADIKAVAGIQGKKLLSPERRSEILEEILPTRLEKVVGKAKEKPEEEVPKEELKTVTKGELEPITGEEAEKLREKPKKQPLGNVIRQGKAIMELLKLPEGKRKGSSEEDAVWSVFKGFSDEDIQEKIDTFNEAKFKKKYGKHLVEAEAEKKEEEAGEAKWRERAIEALRKAKLAPRGNPKSWKTETIRDRLEKAGIDVETFEPTKPAKAQAEKRTKKAEKPARQQVTLEGKPAPPQTRASLEKEYETDFGKRPPKSWKEETIRNKIQERKEKEGIRKPAEKKPAKELPKGQTKLTKMKPTKEQIEKQAKLEAKREAYRTDPKRARTALKNIHKVPDIGLSDEEAVKLKDKLNKYRKGKDLFKEKELLGDLIQQTKKKFKGAENWGDKVRGMVERQSKLVDEMEASGVNYITGKKTEKAKETAEFKSPKSMTDDEIRSEKEKLAKKKFGQRTDTEQDRLISLAHEIEVRAGRRERDESKKEQISQEDIYDETKEDMESDIDDIKEEIKVVKDDIKTAETESEKKKLRAELKKLETELKKATDVSK